MQTEGIRCPGPVFRACFGPFGARGPCPDAEVPANERTASG